MTKEDLQLLVSFLEQNGDHKLSGLEKLAAKAAITKCTTLNELVTYALKLLKGTEKL